MKQRLLRYWFYFRRGYSLYLWFIVGFANFIIIQYSLLVEKYLPSLNLIAFATATIPLILIVGTLIGWLDAKRGSLKTEQAIMVGQNPLFQDLAEALYHISRGQNKKAEMILRKWVMEAEKR